MIPRTLQDILGNMQLEARKQYGDDFHVSESSDWYRENFGIAMAIKLLEDKMLDVQSNMNLKTASDPYFFLNASNFLFYRKLPTKATGTATTRDSMVGAVARVGEIKLRKKGTDIIYYNREALKVDKKEFSFTIESFKTGLETNAENDEVIEIISTPPNWGTFSTGKIQGGQDLETLEEARKRFFNNGVSQSYWNVDGVRAELLRLDGVKSVFVRANPQDTSIDSQPRRSLWCVVEGGRDQEIGEAIFKKFTDATITIGSQSVTVRDRDNNPIEIRFDRPTNVDIDIQVQLLGVDKTSDFREYVKEYLESVKVGGVISNSRALEFIPGYNEYENLDIRFKKQGTSNWVTYIQLGNTEKGVYGVVA